MKILTHVSAIVFWMDKTGFRCPTVLTMILHIHSMRACGPELCSKEISISSHAFFELVIVRNGVAA